MADNEKEIEKLDKEFYELVKKFEGLMCTYNFREKYLITEWLKKLKQSKSSLDESKLRIRFIEYFLNKQEAGINIFRLDPFNKIPKDFSGKLKDFRKLLPKDPGEAIDSTEDEKRSYVADLFESLIDKGEFLAQQPVPRSGSFFILVLKSNKEATNCSLN